MGVLDDAIRDHLELKRKHGASEEELARKEAEALGPARREFVAPPEPEVAAVEETAPAEVPLAADELVAEEELPPEAGFAAQEELPPEPELPAETEVPPEEGALQDVPAIEEEPEGERPLDA